MAKLNGFLISTSTQNVEIEKGNYALQLVAPLSNVILDFFPTNFSFCVAVSLIDIDTNKNTLQIQMETPSGDEIFNSGEAIISGVDDETSVFACLDIKNLVISEPGVYKFNVLYNQEKIYESLFPIIKAKK